MASTFFMGDDGVSIELNLTTDNITPFPIADATVKQIILVKPDKTHLYYNANFVTNGSDGKLVVPIGNVLNQAGRWQVYAYVVGPSYTRTSSVTWFNVTAGT